LSACYNGTKLIINGLSCYFLKYKFIPDTLFSTQSVVIADALQVRTIQYRAVPYYLVWRAQLSISNTI